MEKKQTTVQVVLEPMNLKKTEVTITGKTPLLMDRMGDDIKRGILAKQSGLTKGNKKLVRNIEEEVKNAIHVTSDGKIGFPSYGFKKGMMECTSFVGDKMFSKKLVSGAVKILNSDGGLIPIDFKKQTVLEHSISGQTKFSPVFHEWKAKLVIQYDGNNISLSDIITLLDYAGFYQGVGGWRSKGKDGGSGEYGMYEGKKKGNNIKQEKEVQYQRIWHKFMEKK